MSSPDKEKMLNTLKEISNHNKESNIQKKIIKYLEKEGAYVRNIISASVSGTPDLLVCYKGHFIGLEIKTKETKCNVSPLQAYNLKQIEKAGGYSASVYSVEQVKDLIKVVNETIISSNRKC